MIASETLHGRSSGNRPSPNRGLIYFLIFSVSFLSLFLLMSREVIPYDEGLILTGAMRVAHGQVPHRDFYANYGPAQFYLLAGLFRLFGESVFVERVFDVFLKSLLITWIYALIAQYCRRSLAAWTFLAALILLFDLHYATGIPTVPVSLLNVIGCSLFLPVFSGAVSIRRMIGIGAVAGCATLFRYDTGVALCGVIFLASVFAICSRVQGNFDRVRAAFALLWPVLLGFVCVVGPAAIFYLSRAPLHDFFHDIIQYPSMFYNRARRLPFPRFNPFRPEEAAVYLTLAIIGLSLCLALFASRRDRQPNSGAAGQDAGLERWRGFLITFGLLALAMYAKAFVRISLLHLYLCMIPTLVLVVLLFEYRGRFHRVWRITILFVAIYFAFSLVWVARLEWRSLHQSHAFVWQTFGRPSGATSGEASYCPSPGPLTQGLCFATDENRMAVANFIDAHTSPEQTLYVGLQRHDQIFINDNLLYFAAQRLPATKWSHFDPDLQNTAPIQSEMIVELEGRDPPYLVLDSEYESQYEPNDSSVSTGVTLLDTYIATHYRQIQSHGTFSIWERQPVSSPRAVMR